VVQTRSTEDTRRRHLALTAKGRQIDRGRKGTVEGAVRRAAATLSSDELAVAARVMDALATHLAAE
jgi:DNA-binding MarR family transcriptional regulator